MVNRESFNAKIEFREKLVQPTLRLIVPSEGDIAELDVTWHINEGDASVWRRPLSIAIRPKEPYSLSPEEKKYFNDHFWETIIDLSREDVRLLRDFMSSLLKSPDLREEDED